MRLWADIPGSPRGGVMDAALQEALVTKTHLKRLQTEKARSIRFVARMRDWRASQARSKARKGWIRTDRPPGSQNLQCGGPKRGAPSRVSSALALDSKCGHAVTITKVP